MPEAPRQQNRAGIGAPRRNVRNDNSATNPRVKPRCSRKPTP